MLDIANKLGVSVVTVSNALAGRDGVSLQLRKKICDTAEELGYIPSAARNSKRKVSALKTVKTVGLITSERYVGGKGTFYWELTANISNRLSSANAFTVYECISSENEQNAVMPNIITENKADGLIVIGQLSRNYLEKLSRINIPLLFVDFYDTRFNVDSVNSDSYHGGYIITDYLVEMGHRKIGFFGKVNATSSINDRFLGYIKCLMENNLEYRKEWTINDRDEKGILYTRIIFPDDMPTAFVCNSDETAFRVIAALKSKGVRVPEDISVVGYDNYTVSSICIPEITTVEVDLDRMACAAVEIMTRKICDPSYREGRKIISGKLIVKDSVLNIHGGCKE
ncbi:MAG: LacI family DNA-binding transcriptional regulator [Ruminococcus sp.]|nr:LacI family DNA-binding transcriptional regulator [Ruminococcus sp.]